MTSRKNFIESNNQIFSRIRRINNRGINYHIPSEITQLLIDLGNEKHPNKVLDLTYCSNNLLSPFLEDAETIKGVELNNVKIEDIEDSTEYHIISREASIFQTNKKFDLVFCMPPFGERIIVNNRNVPSELVFVEKALSMLENEGILLFLCPNVFLTAQIFQEIRTVIMNNYDLEMILSIPRTQELSIPLSLLIIKNVPPTENDNVLMMEYQHNRRMVLENYLTQTSELVVKKHRMSHRWDPHFFNPKFDKIKVQLQDKEVYRLDELGQVVRGISLRPNERKQKGKYLLLTPRHIRHTKEIEKTDRDFYIDEIDSVRDRQAILHPGDMLINLQGEKNIYTFTENDPPSVAGPMFGIIRSKDNEYIKTYLNTEDGQQLFRLQAYRKSRDTVLRHISIRDLREIKIPILPFKNLNKLSDKYIEESHDREELEAIKKELETQKALNEQMQQTNQQLMGFLQNRFDAIDNKLDTIIVKVDNILEHLEKLQSEITVIKTLQADEEQIIEFIEQKIDETVEKVTNDNLDPYIKIVKAWIDPNWFKLEMLSQVFLPSAELLYDNLSRMEHGDPSPFIIQYCRTMENELLEKVFRPYLRDLNKRNIIVEKEFSQDLQTNANGNPTNRNRDSYHFAIYLKKLQRRDESEWFFELGRMSFILTKLTGRRAENSPLLQDFKRFILKSFDEDFINREFYEKIGKLTKNFRNRAAHPNVIDTNEALKGRDKIKELLKLLIELYK